ncbi:MAG: asparagine synthase (glutamine-hydrolyzing), partial [Gemmatimonadaceae bacterium]
RYGEKPLYYGWQGDAFLFASELPSIKAHPLFNAAIDRNVLALYLRHNCIPAPWSIYRGIFKQMPGTIVRISRADREPSVTTYWSVQQVIDTAAADPFRGSPDEAVSELEARLSDAVNGQMMSDVPLGAFLSGGVDSSTIVALMQRQSTRPVNTFTIGFDDAVYDESSHARAVARHLGTNHEELIVSPAHARDVIPRLSAMYGEPFADSSQIPTFLVSQLARQHVTVSLSGDGGDELFAGYNRYVLTHKLWKSTSQVPRPLRMMTGRMIARVSEQRWNTMLGPMQRVLPSGLAQVNLGTKLHKSARVMAAASTRGLYRSLISHWTHPNDVVIGAHEPETLSSSIHALEHVADDVHEMMALDQLTYLPDDILTKVDRAAMAVSLETRVPLLDHRVAAFAWSLPLDYLLRDGASKWPLRQVLYRYVPKALIERPKAGFAVPIGDWLRGPLRDWAENLLDESRLISEGFFHPAAIRSKWLEHARGRRNHEYLLWDVLMFQAWLAEAR